MMASYLSLTIYNDGTFIKPVVKGLVKVIVKGVVKGIMIRMGMMGGNGFHSYLHLVLIVELSGIVV